MVRSGWRNGSHGWMRPYLGSERLETKRWVSGKTRNWAYPFDELVISCLYLYEERERIRMFMG